MSLCGLEMFTVLYWTLCQNILERERESSVCRIPYIHVGMYSIEEEPKERLNILGASLQ